ncbi:hypothetical protein ACN20G_28175 (plasmid) [Streptomyces sp. BI20]|uniref:hypothetical protein n=1 Tax=Streptomyces sp. BI20 TaxID=3403460 RepID=UPI003C747D88
MTSIRVHGAGQVIAAFGVMPALLAVTARQAVEVSANHIKADSRRRGAGSGYRKHYANSITYDLRASGPASVWAEVGPDKARRQGALGNIIEFGTSRNAPIPHLGPALAAEASGFYAGMVRAVRDATR